MNNTMTREKGALVYQFKGKDGRKRDRTLFVNLVPQYECPNTCRFCGRKDAEKGIPNIYENGIAGGGSFFLPVAPLMAEIMDELRAKIKKPDWLGLGGTKEIAIVGLGEPLTQYDLLLRTIRDIKREFGLWVRLDTNGRGDLVPMWWFGCAAERRNGPQELKIAGLDEVTVSVNATNGLAYEILCVGNPTASEKVMEPRWQENNQEAYSFAFENVRDFVRGCIRAGIKTRVSFVVGYQYEWMKAPARVECLKFAHEEFGLKRNDVIFREFVPPLSRDTLVSAVPNR